MKFILIFILTTLVSFVPVYAHTVRFEDGRIVKGRITTVSDGLIKITTPEGDMSIVREGKRKVYNDSVVIGIPFFPQTYRAIPSRVIYMDNEYVRAQTDQGQVHIHKLKVRDVIIYIDKQI